MILSTIYAPPQHYADWPPPLTVTVRLTELDLRDLAAGAVLTRGYHGRPELPCRLLVSLHLESAP